MVMTKKISEKFLRFAVYHDGNPIEIKQGIESLEDEIKVIKDQWEQARLTITSQVMRAESAEARLAKALEQLKQCDTCVLNDNICSNCFKKALGIDESMVDARTAILYSKEADE